MEVSDRVLEMNFSGLKTVTIVISLLLTIKELVLMVDMRGSAAPRMENGTEGEDQ